MGVNTHSPRTGRASWCARWILAVGALLTAIVAAAPVSAANEALTSALAQLPKSGGTVQLDAGVYPLHAPLNLRGRAATRIVGAGAGTVLQFELPPECAGQPLIDLTGARRCELSQLTITVRGRTRPNVALILARDKRDGDSAGLHRFESLVIAATCDVANVVCFGSEVNTWTHCTFQNSVAGGGNFVSGRDNWLNVSSPFGPVAGGSNVCQEFIGCYFGVYGRSGREVNITLGSGTGHYAFRGGTVSNKCAVRTDRLTGGRAGFLIGGPGPRAVTQIVLDNVQAETWGAKHTIEVRGLTFGLAVRNCMLQALESSIHIGGQMEDSRFELNTLDAGFAEYDWGRRTGALVTVDAICIGNHFDLAPARLGRLARDATATFDRGWPTHALRVGKQGHLAHNEIRLRKADDLHLAGGKQRDNRITLTRTPQP